MTFSKLNVIMVNYSFYINEILNSYLLMKVNITKHLILQMLEFKRLIITPYC